MHRPAILVTAIVLSFVAGRYFPADNSNSAGSGSGATIPRADGSASKSFAPPVAKSAAPAEKAAPTSPPATEADAAAAKKLLGMLEGMAENEESADPSTVFAKWMAADPQAAVDFLSASPKRDQLLRQVFAAWAKHNPEAASAWLAPHKDSPGRDAMAAGLAGAVVKDDPAAATQWVSSIADPELKMSAGQETGYEFYRQSDASAQESLKSMGFPESASSPLMEAWKTRFDLSTDRKAQGVTAQFNAAQAAGANLTASSIEDAMTLVEAGVKGGGAFSSSVFKVEQRDQTEREHKAVVSRLDLQQGEGTTLIYKGR